MSKDTETKKDISPPNVNKSDTQNKDVESVDADIETTSMPQDQTVTAKPKNGNGFVWFVFLLLLMTAGALGYLGYLFWQEKNNLYRLVNDTDKYSQQFVSVESSVNKIEGLLENSETVLSEKLQKQSESVKKLQSDLNNAQASIDAQSRRLLSLTATTTDDWRLAEVEYLLRLANQRIMTTKDGETALSLLKASDQIIKELADPRLFKLREALANDIAAISLIDEQDLDGVYLQLSSLGKQISRLPLLDIPRFEKAEAQEYTSNDSVKSEQSQAEEAVKSFLKTTLNKISEIGTSTWNELRKYIVIQQRETQIKPLLPPDQQYYLRNNLQLLLNQAQLALLDGRQAPYTESLNNAASWLREYFPLDEKANKVVLEEIEKLSEINVAVEYPDVTASLLAIRAFINEQHRMGRGEPATAQKKTVKAEK